MKKNGENYFEKYLKNKEYLQVYQNEKTDGFFICKLAKIRLKENVTEILHLHYGCVKCIDFFPIKYKI